MKKTILISVLISVFVVAILGAGVWWIYDKNLKRANFAPSIPNVDVDRPDLFAIFEGRTPCTADDIFKGCELTKLRLTLFKGNSNQPITYRLGRVSVGLGNDLFTTEGKLTIVKDTKTIPGAEIYQLDENTPNEYRWWLSIGKNILLELDQDQNIKIGNAGASYTLSRTR